MSALDRPRARLSVSLGTPQAAGAGCVIERVARAIYEARYGGGNWDVLLKQRSAKHETAKWRAMARAAIKAMEPR